MANGARFWAVDLHVHTPASDDANESEFGDAEAIVKVALDAGLDGVVIADHNTAAMCDELSAEGIKAGLVVFPGVEVSTTEGHLIALWDVGTTELRVNEALVALGIGMDERGKLDIAASMGIAEAAKIVSTHGGIAIAAHADRAKGLLSMPVKAHLERTLQEPSLSAVELVDLGRKPEVDLKVAGIREMAIVQGSDTWNSTLSAHSLTGIGSRRTWIKAGQLDLTGIRHALADPELRVRVGAGPAAPDYSYIERVELQSGFLRGVTVELGPDLNCLLGGTGAGKSLILESIRFALDQQVDAKQFSALRAEVENRLLNALGEGGTVRVTLRGPEQRHIIERTFSRGTQPPPVVKLASGNDWVEVDLDPSKLLPLAAFSQGEVLEYSRQPVGRMSLVDSGLDLTDVNTRLAQVEGSLRENAKDLLACRVRIETLEQDRGALQPLRDQVKTLAALFSTEVVKAQADWAADDAALKKAQSQVEQIQPPMTPTIDGALSAQHDASAPHFATVNAALVGLGAAVKAASQAIADAKQVAKTSVDAARAKWQFEFATFQNELDAELEKHGADASTTTLRAQLQEAQTRLNAAEQADAELVKVVRPQMAALVDDREKLVAELQAARHDRRELRRKRVQELNAKAAGFVKLDVPSHGDDTDYRRALDAIKVGSRVREDVLNAIGLYTHPTRFVREMWAGKPGDLADDSKGIDAVSLTRLLAAVADKELWAQLLEMQLIDRPDVLTVKFRKPEDGDYSSIEDLSHGQRCTAILVILLADGSNPVIVDQPEDALHAPWIEDYLVDRLRSLRGSRQYLFATRSPGIVVSADAEQIITMKATAGHGEVEAVGSLERHDLNLLTLHHLEGGEVPFDRRAQKLRRLNK